MTAVFLSHASTDRAHALALHAVLVRHDYGVFLDASSIPGGTEWVAEIQHALEDCNVVVVMCSDRAWEPGRWVQRELLFAERLKKPVIPVLLGGALPLLLVDRHFVDGRVDVEEYAVDLLAAIARFVVSPARADQAHRLIGAAVCAQMAGDSRESTTLYLRAASMDASLPRTAAEVWAQLAGSSQAPLMSLSELHFIVDTEKLEKSVYRDGRKSYRWTLRIDADAGVLDRISHVKYDLSDYYTAGLRLVRARSSGFSLSEHGWGPLAFRVHIVLTDGHALDTWVDLTLERHQRFPAPTAPFPLG